MPFGDYYAAISPFPRYPQYVFFCGKLQNRFAYLGFLLYLCLIFVVQETFLW